MTTSAQAIFQFAGLKASLFPANSRYMGIDTGTFAGAGNRTIVYVRRRFVPPANLFSTIQQHNVTQGERLDNIAAGFLGDPELFWRLCDGNGVMRAEELEKLATVVRITLPLGIGTTPNG